MFYFIKDFLATFFLGAQLISNTIDAGQATKWPEPMMAQFTDVLMCTQASQS